MTDGCEVVVVSAKVRGSEKGREREGNERALNLGLGFGWKLVAPGGGENARGGGSGHRGQVYLDTLVAQLRSHLASTLFCPCNILSPELTTLS